MLRSTRGGRRARVRHEEVDERLALEPHARHVVASTSDRLQDHAAAELGVALAQLRGVLLDRHRAVRVAVDVEDRERRLRERREAVDRIVLREHLLEGVALHAVGAATPVEARPRAQVADRVDAGDARDALGMVRRPVVEHQPAAAAREEACAFGVTTPHELRVQRSVERTPRGVAVGLADVDAGDRNALREQALEDPLLGLGREPGKRRRIHHPRLRRRCSPLFLRWRDQEGAAPAKLEELARQWESLLRRVLRFGRRDGETNEEAGGDAEQAGPLREHRPLSPASDDDARAARCSWMRRRSACRSPRCPAA